MIHFTSEEPSQRHEPVVEDVEGNKKELIPILKEDMNGQKMHNHKGRRPSIENYKEDQEF